MGRKLPIGIQDFADIRENNFVYVDKSAVIHRLISGSGKAFFLSRPRRFGKSLLCSTLGALFESRRDLFQGLAINELEWEWKKHPVIRLDLNAGNYTEGLVVLKSGLKNTLENAAMGLGITLRGELLPEQFGNLIQDAYKNYGEKTVVIIDEYDKPLLSTIDNPELHVKMRDELKGFYGVLKSSDAHLRFVFLTGVTKFSHVSIFSDLNHLVDLSLDPCYADICGLTQEEVEQNFEPEINAIAQSTGKERETYMEKLRRFYNGYRFSRKPLKVYNPFGLFNHFTKNGEFLSFWYETGTPTFLVKLIIKQKINILDLNRLYVRYSDFSKYDIETMRAEPLLYQSGYLTIVDYDEKLNQFILDYPNTEVRASFAQSLLELYAPSSDTTLNTQLPRALFYGDVELAMNTLKAFFASIPYDLIDGKESYYQTAIHLIFTILGMDCRSEVRTSSGRIDTIIEMENYMYCFEFKLDGTADEALAQIDTKEYLLPWKYSGKKLFKVGVSFHHEKRNIGEWKVAEQTQE